MMRNTLFALIVLSSAAVGADVVVSPEVVLGPVKPMNAVNNGPVRANRSMCRENFTAYRHARIPFARTHDSINCINGGAHTCDITAVFPDFDADENDPKSYDFVFTDKYLDGIRAAGTEVFFRLGQTIEHGPKKYGTVPPKDFAKWARICEHVIRHYNEGWADGFHWNIRYWEIWNEPDLEKDDEPDHRTWGGTTAQFFDFFEVAAKHLKGRFPDLKIGGPALAWRRDWADRFLKAMSERKVPIDFFSWHVYCDTMERVTNDATYMKKTLVKYGYDRTESVLNEWNYRRDWKKGFLESVRAFHGMKGAAFEATMMCTCQRLPVDLLMYYDARTSTTFNGMFDFYTYAPLKGYWPIWAWSRFRDYGSEVKCEVTDQTGVSAVAARSAEGRIAVYLSRYLADDNAFATEEVKIRLPGANLAEARVRLVDSRYSFAEAPFDIEDGAIVVMLEPWSFLFVEL